MEGDQALADARAAALESEVANLLGQPATLLSLPDARSLPEPPALPDTGLPADLAIARPDVLAARARLAAADYRLASALDTRLPSVSLSGSLVSVEDTLAALFSDVLWQLGAELALPLFDGGLRAGQIDAARAGVDAALYDYANTWLNALNEVNAALAASSGSDRYAASLQGQLEDARRVLTLSRDAYRLGQGGYLNVLLALQSVQNLERAQVQARQQQYTDRIVLCRALGRTVGAPGAAMAVAGEAR